MARILIVDDHEAVRRSLRSMVSEHRDWSVCGEASDGIEAVDKARESRPDVVLMDVSMPRMDGLKATRQILEERPETKVILVSQNDPAVVQRQVTEAGAHGFVEKSAVSEKLMSTIEGLLERRSTTSAARKEQGSTWLFGGGALGEMIRERDWSQTVLGPLDKWPACLRTSANLMLNSQHPMWIGWGREMAFLYNDAYISVLGAAKHPWALGRPASEVWAEIWDVCGPLADKVFSKGEPSFADNVQLFMKRGEALEETYYSFSYSPIYDESGKVGGLFCPSAETTGQILHARRLQTLSELSSKALVEKSTQGSCASFLRTLETNPDDIPFAALYLLDAERREARLEGTSRVRTGLEGITPAMFSLMDGGTGKAKWPLREVVGSLKPEVMSLEENEELPRGPANQAVREAMALPLISPGHEGTFGALLLGVNPTRKLDAEYRTFFSLVADQLVTAMENATATEREVQRAEELAELDRAKTAFFSNVSHEFRTPLTLMLGPIEDLLAKSHTGLAPAAKGQLEVVNRNGARLLRLVNTLLDFSRIEAGRVQAMYQRTDLGAFTAELASVFRSATERAGLELRIECPSLPEAVYVDRDMWEKIVLNLMSNAFKFTFDGEIAVSVRRAGDSAELEVRDTGVGIAAEQLPRLFERFHRIENARSRTHEGSGIGLALVHELVKLHGGTLQAESELGRGTTFRVKVPLGKEHLLAERIGRERTSHSTAVGAAPFVQEALRWLPDADEEVDADLVPHDTLLQVPCPPEGADGERPRVLIADDNADMRQYLARLLAERYEVTLVGDGRSAVEVARKQTPDLVLSDVMMPMLDGFGVIRELRSDPTTAEIPIILLSARAGEESRVEGVEAGADDYLIKPFSARELMARVESHLKMHRMRQEANEAVRQSEERLRALVNASSYVAFRMNPDWTEMRQLDGHGFVSDTERRSREWLQQYVDADDQPMMLEKIREAVRAKSLFELEHRVRRADGTTGWTLSRAVPLMNTNGEITEWFGTASDVTARHQTEENLREHRERLASIVASTHDAIISKDLNGVVTSWNEGAERLFEYSAKEAIGQPILLIVPQELHGEEREILSRLRNGERIEHYETVRQTKSGARRRVSLTISPLRDQRGRVVGVSKIARDITERFRVEQATKEAELSGRLLQLQDEERRRIARELHDGAGQLLAALGMNLAALAREKGRLSAEGARAVEENTALLGQALAEIRTTSHLLHPPLLDEVGLKSALTEYVEGFAERSKIQATLELPEALGELPPDYELSLFRIVQECLTNVHRHAKSAKALVRLTQRDHEIQLEVSDEGRGMSQEVQEKFIAGTSAGVGLRGMRERVRQIGGSLQIQSDEKGTTVKAVLPIRGARAPEERPSAGEDDVGRGMVRARTRAQ